jgi:hypothetical protein
MVHTYDLETSFTLSWRNWAWGIERMVLDAVSNHLPHDAKGTRVDVSFRQGDDIVDFREYDPSKPVDEILMEDDGCGYSARRLMLALSGKDHMDASVGQFGEGLKLVSTTALRLGQGITFHSKNWHASPFTIDGTLDAQDYKQLCFHVRENGEHIEGSRTVFDNPSADLIKEVLQLPEKVLAFAGDYEVLYEAKPLSMIFTHHMISIPMDFTDVSVESYDQAFTYVAKELQETHSMPSVMKGFSSESPKPASRILNLGQEDNRRVFVKGVYVQRATSLFDYDLAVDLPPDRHFVNERTLLDEIEIMLKSCSNANIVDTILDAAHDKPDFDYFEFKAFSQSRKPEVVRGLASRSTHTYEMDSSPLNKILFSKGERENIWAGRFKEKYGEQAVLASNVELENTDAGLMGYTVIRLNDHVSTYLEQQGVTSASNIEVKTNYKWLPLDTLTETEQRYISTLDEVHRLGFSEEDSDPNIEFRVYEGLYTETGREIDSSLGVCQWRDGEKTIVGLKQSQLQGDFVDFLTSYLHEVTHAVTKAGDGDRRFVDYAFRGWAHMVAQQIDLGKTET